MRKILAGGQQFSEFTISMYYYGSTTHQHAFSFSGESIKWIYHIWIMLTLPICSYPSITSLYRESPHKTVKWEAEKIVLCETVLFQIEYRNFAKKVLCETLLRTMRGIGIFHK